MPQGQKPSQLDRLVAEESDRILDEEADRQQVPRQFVQKIKKIESGGAPDVISGQRRSSAGAVGAMQLMPATARGLGVDPYDIEQNVMGGVKYAKQQLDTFGDQRLAASAYNAGPGAVRKAGGVPRIAETQKYASQFPSGQQGESELDKLVNQFGGTEDDAGPLERVTKPQPRIKPSRQITKTRGPAVQRQAESSPFSFTRPTLAQAAQQQVARRTAQISPEVSAEADRLGRLQAEREARIEAKRQAYSQKSTLGRRLEDVTEGLAQAGEFGQRQFENLLTLTGARKAISSLSPAAAEALKRGQEAQAYTAQQMAERAEAANSLASRATRGLTAGGVQAATMLPIAATTGGLGVAAATGLGQDWNDPAAAILNTALAPLPLKVGQAVSGVAGRAASRVAAPIAQGLIRRGIETGAGAATGAGQYAATQGILGRPIDPEEAITQSVVGGALGGALAPRQRPPGLNPDQILERQLAKAQFATPAEIRAKFARGRQPLGEGDLFTPPSPAVKDARALRQIEQQRPSDRLQEYPGGELPRGYGAPLEGQPIEQPEPAIRTYPAPMRPAIGELPRVLPRRQPLRAEEAPVEPTPEAPPRERLPRIADLPPVLPRRPSTPIEPTGPSAVPEPQPQPAPSPRPPSRSEQRNIERGQQVLRARDDAANAQTRAAEFERSGDFDSARRAIIEQIDALRATRAKVKIDTPGGRKLRSNLGRQIEEAQQRVGSLRQRGREAAKARQAIELAPTTELQPSRPSTQQRLTEIEQQTPSERLREYPGGELPRTVGRPVEGQPIESVTRETGTKRALPPEMPAPATQPQAKGIEKQQAAPQPTGTRPKTVGEYAEGLRGEIPTGELQAYQRLLQRERVENPRPEGERTRPGEPFGGLSQFSDIVTNNRDAVNRLAEMNVNSPEAEPLIREIRDYARKNRFDERHIDNLLNQIRNDQLQRAQGEDIAVREPNQPTAGLREGDVRLRPPTEPSQPSRYGRFSEPALRQKIDANNAVITRLQRRTNDPKAQARIEEIQRSNAEIQIVIESKLPKEAPAVRTKGSAPLEIPPETGPTIQEVKAQERERIGKLSPQALEAALTDVERRRNEAVRTGSEAEAQSLADQVRLHRARRAELVKAGQLPPLYAKRPARGERPQAKEAAIKSPLDQDVTQLELEVLEKRIRDAERILESPEISQDRKRKVEDFLRRAREERGRRRPNESLPETAAMPKGQAPNVPALARIIDTVNPRNKKLPGRETFAALDQARILREGTRAQMEEYWPQGRVSDDVFNTFVDEWNSHPRESKMNYKGDYNPENVAKLREAAYGTKEEARTVTHPDETINGKPIIAETTSGKVVVANPENKSGISVVKDRSAELKAPIKAAQDKVTESARIGEKLANQVIADFDRNGYSIRPEGFSEAYGRLDNAERIQILRDYAKRGLLPAQYARSRTPLTASQLWDALQATVKNEYENWRLSSRGNGPDSFSETVFAKQAALKTPPQVAAMKQENQPIFTKERTLPNGAKEFNAKMGDQELTIRQLSKGGSWDVVDPNGKVIRQRLGKEEAKRAARLELTKERPTAEIGERKIPALSDEAKTKIESATVDAENIDVNKLGFENRLTPTLRGRTKKTQTEVNIDDITLSRDILNRDRLMKMESDLAQGVKRQKAFNIEVTPDPQNPGKYIISNDGNHRVAYLKLAGQKGKIPVTLVESLAKPKFVTDAEQRLQETASGKRAGSGIESLADQAVVTGYNIYRAGMRYGQWARAVTRQAGNAVRPHLQKAWQAIQQFYREEAGSAVASPGSPKRSTPISELRAITAESLRGPEEPKRTPREPISGAPSGRDVSGLDYLRSPLSNLNFKGTYERLAGNQGREVSEIIRNAQVEIAQRPDADRSQLISQLRRDLKPYKEQFRDDGQPGLANWLDEHVNALSDPDSAFRGLAGFLRGFHYNFKLRFNPRSVAINWVQPLQTLWPHVTTAEYVKLIKDARTPSIRKRVLEMAERESGGQVEEVGKKRILPNPFGTVSDSNRVMGHLAGEMFADRLGLTGEAKARMAADWAKKIEYDNSRWDVPPLFRGKLAGVVGQFKPFTVKNLERLYSDWKSAPEGSETGTLARRAKMITGQVVLGGVRSALPGVKSIAGVLVLGGLAKSLSKVMDEKEADKLAETIYFGAPGLIEQDISSSMMLLDAPFGNTASEKAVNFFGGPTASLILKAWQEGETMYGAKDTRETTRGEKLKASGLRLAKAVTPYTKTAEAAYDLARGQRPTMNLGGAQEPLSNLETAGKLLMSTPVRQTRYYEEKEAFDWQKRLLGKPTGKAEKLQTSVPERLRGEPEDLYRRRVEKVDQWSDQYGQKLLASSEFQRLSAKEKDTALDLLSRRIREQANLVRQDMRSLEPGMIVRSLRRGDSMRDRRRNKYIYQPPED